MLLERVQQGDEQAIALLYERYSGVVYSIALRVLQDSALAEQILSDIFLEIWRSPERFAQQTGSLSLSLAIIARNRTFEVLGHKPGSVVDLASSCGISKDRERNLTRAAACAAFDELPKGGAKCWRRRSSMECPNQRLACREVRGKLMNSWSRAAPFRN
jgi:RNA polymerase sigma-70 factor (ECF subfamily)